MRSVLAPVVAWGAAIAPALADSSASPENPENEDLETPNTGQDVTNPVTRVDLRAQYQYEVGGFNNYVFTLRTDRPYVLGDGWKLSLRVDAPFVDNDFPVPDNPAGDYRLGFGNVLGQALLIKTLNAVQAFGFGAQIIAPTSTGDQFGPNSFFQIVPTFGYRWALPQISLGSFVVPTLRWDASVGAPEGQRISNLQFAPTLNIALPNQVFLTLYPSTDIRYEFITHSPFVPANVMLGKLWGKSVVTSLELAEAIVYGRAPLYRFKTEARVGVFF